MRMNWVRTSQVCLEGSRESGKCVPFGRERSMCVGQEKGAGGRGIVKRKGGG